MSEAQRIGTRLVELCNSGASEQAVDELYSDRIVSIEGQGSDEMPARMEGFAAIRKKGEWWFANHEVHAMKASGPFCGHRDDQFVVQFDIDITPKASGQRTRMSEVGIYTVKGGKVAQEEFLYLMG
jgi:SnoaL-like domain